MAAMSMWPSAHHANAAGAASRIVMMASVEVSVGFMALFSAGSLSNRTRRDSLDFESFNSLCSPGSRIDCHHIQFHIAFKHNKPFQEFSRNCFGVSMDVYTVDFKGFVRAEDRREG